MQRWYPDSDIARSNRIFGRRSIKTDVQDSRLSERDADVCVEFDVMVMNLWRPLYIQSTLTGPPAPQQLSEGILGCGDLFISLRY